MNIKTKTLSKKLSLECLSRLIYKYNLEPTSKKTRYEMEIPMECTSHAADCAAGIGNYDLYLAYFDSSFLKDLVRNNSLYQAANAWEIWYNFISEDGNIETKISLEKYWSTDLGVIRPYVKLYIGGDSPLKEKAKRFEAISKFFQVFGLEYRDHPLEETISEEHYFYHSAGVNQPYSSPELRWDTPPEIDHQAVIVENLEKIEDVLPDKLVQVSFHINNIITNYTDMKIEEELSTINSLGILPEHFYKKISHFDYEQYLFDFLKGKLVDGTYEAATSKDGSAKLNCIIENGKISIELEGGIKYTIPRKYLPPPEQ